MRPLPSLDPMMSLTLCALLSLAAGCGGGEPRGNETGSAVSDAGGAGSDAGGAGSDAGRAGQTESPNPGGQGTPVSAGSTAAGSTAGQATALADLSTDQLNALQACFQRGAFRANAGEWVDAIAEFRQAVAIAPGYAEAHFRLGRALSGQGSQQDFAGALEEFDRARVLGLYDARVAFGRANALSELDRYSEALGQVDELLDEDSSGTRAIAGEVPAVIEIQARLLRVTIALRRNDADQATADLAAIKSLIDADQSGALSPFVAEYHMRSGLLAKSRRQWEEATGEFEKVLEANPEDREARYQLAICLDRKGDKEGAARQREIHSLFVDAQGSVANKDRSDTARLAPVYQRLKELLPEYRRAWARMVRAYIFAREYSSGVTEAEAGLAAIPDEPAQARIRGELYYLMGNCLSKLGESATTLAEQRAYLNRAIGCFMEAGRLQPGFAPRAQEFVRQIQQTLRNFSGRDG